MLYGGLPHLPKQDEKVTKSIFSLNLGHALLYNQQKEGRRPFSSRGIAYYLQKSACPIPVETILDEKFSLC